MSALDPQIRSRLYLRAVFPRIVDLCHYDGKTRDRVASVGSFRIRIIVRNGLTQAIRVDTVAPSSLSKSDSTEVTLALANAGQLNALFSGKGFSLPIPIKGIFRLRALSAFKAISKRLESILLFEDSVADDPRGPELFARISLYTVIAAATELALHEPFSREQAIHFPSGLVTIEVAETDICVWFEKTIDSVSFGIGEPPRAPDAKLEIGSLQIANTLLADRLDSIAAIGRGDLRISGLIPLIDGLGGLMERVSLYLRGTTDFSRQPQSP